MKSKKPIINKETYKHYVAGIAQLTGQRTVKSGEFVFNQTDIENAKALVARVSELAAVFTKGETHTPIPLNLAAAGNDYRLRDRAVDSQTYRPYKSYYARAFAELVAIAVAVADGFSGMMVPGFSTSRGPGLSVQGKNDMFIALVGTAAEGYHQARFEALLDNYLNVSFKSVEQPTLQQIHMVIQQSVHVVIGGANLTTSYSAKRWKRV